MHAVHRVIEVSVGQSLGQRRRLAVAACVESRGRRTDNAFSVSRARHVGTRMK